MIETKLTADDFSKYQSRLKKYISQKVGDENDVDELLQETLISATDSLPTFSGNSLLFTWLCGIANHEIADFYRKRKIKAFLFSHFPFLEEIISEALSPEEILLENELRREVKKKLSVLSEGYSKILRLKYYQGLSVREIAQKLGTTVKAIESKLSRAREAFRLEWLREKDNYG